MSALEKIDPLTPSEIAYEAFDADSKLKLERSYRDVMRSNLGSLIRATGKKSATFGGYHCSIVTNHSPRCACHLTYIDACDAAKAGEPIVVMFVDVERVVVKAVTK